MRVVSRAPPPTGRGRATLQYLVSELCCVVFCERVSVAQASSETHCIAQADFQLMVISQSQLPEC